MASVEVFYSKKERAYTGAELKPHFLLTEFGLKGSALAAFVGPCHVETEHLVDWEDRIAQDFIEAKSMIHFIGEFFGPGLREGVLQQRLFMSILGQAVNDVLTKAGRQDARVRRDGDDLFALDRKMSVSIVTASPVSLLLHAGINLDPSGAPVPAVGLLELGFTNDMRDVWIETVLKSFQEEWQSMDWACAKVRPVM